MPSHTDILTLPRNDTDDKDDRSFGTIPTPSLRTATHCHSVVHYGIILLSCTFRGHPFDSRLSVAMAPSQSIHAISVIVPENPFVRGGLRSVKHCLAALNVSQLMEWWPGQPHTPHRQADKVKAIQRSLDWKRVANIAAYLLQKEIVDVPDRLDRYFAAIYQPKQFEPGREWPPRVSRVVGYQRSEYPTFSNVLLHVNGAKIERLASAGDDRSAKLVFDADDPHLNFAVIDGQHRINGAYFAVQILKETDPNANWEIPAEIFVDLDRAGDPPRHQAQIFIDVNFYQKKVDRSLVADLFPTARGARKALDNKERAQDLGRKLMLEVGPLVGMIQIPGIKFGVKDVVTLATLNSAIESELKHLHAIGLTSLEEQSEFLAQCLDAWLEASGRKEELAQDEKLDPENVAYQGRVVVSFLTLIPACIVVLKNRRVTFISEKAQQALTKWLGDLMDRAGLRVGGRFLTRSKFREKGFLGSGGIARFRDTLWAAAFAQTTIARLGPDKIAQLAEKNQSDVYLELF